MPNYEIISPLYLTLVVLYFISASIKMCDIRRAQAEKGMLGIESFEISWRTPPLPKWTSIFLFLDWLFLLGLLILNWKTAILIWVIHVILNWFDILPILGGILMLPFRPKYPKEVPKEHLSIATALRILNNTSSENDKVFSANYEKVREEIEQIEGSKEDEELILKALTYLGQSEWLVQNDVAEFCSQRREDIEWQKRKENWAKQEREWEEQSIESEKQQKKEDEEMDRIMQMWEESNPSEEEKL